MYNLTIEFVISEFFFFFNIIVMFYSTLLTVCFLQIPELSNPSVCMKDPQRVKDILQSMVKAGSNTLQVRCNTRNVRSFQRNRK